MCLILMNLIFRVLLWKKQEEFEHVFHFFQDSNMFKFPNAEISFDKSLKLLFYMRCCLS